MSRTMDPIDRHPPTYHKNRTDDTPERTNWHWVAHRAYKLKNRISEVQGDLRTSQWQLQRLEDTPALKMIDKQLLEDEELEREDNVESEKERKDREEERRERGEKGEGEEAAEVEVEEISCEWVEGQKLSLLDMPPEILER